MQVKWTNAELLEYKIKRKAKTSFRVESHKRKAGFLIFIFSITY